MAKTGCLQMIPDHDVRWMQKLVQPPDGILASRPEQGAHLPDLGILILGDGPTDNLAGVWQGCEGSTFHAHCLEQQRPKTAYMPPPAPHREVADE